MYYTLPADEIGRREVHIASIVTAVALVAGVAVALAWWSVRRVGQLEDQLRKGEVGPGYVTKEEFTQLKNEFENHRKLRTPHAHPYPPRADEL